MKPILKFLPVICFFLSFTGCKKNDDQPAFQNYLKYKLDGIPAISDMHIRATPPMPQTLGGDQNILISGDWSGGSISLEIRNGTTLTTGQYLFQPSLWRTGEIWTSGPSGRYYFSGSGIGAPNVVGSGQITISEIDAVYIKGSFDFVTGIDPATNTYKTVTEGEFYIKRG